MALACKQELMRSRPDRDMVRRGTARHAAAVPWKETAPGAKLSAFEAAQNAAYRWRRNAAVPASGSELQAWHGHERHKSFGCRPGGCLAGITALHTTGTRCFQRLPMPMARRRHLSRNTDTPRSDSPSTQATAQLRLAALWQVWSWHGNAGMVPWCMALELTSGIPRGVTNLFFSVGERRRCAHSSAASARSPHRGQQDPILVAAMTIFGEQPFVISRKPTGTSTRSVGALRRLNPVPCRWAASPQHNEILSGSR